MHAGREGKEASGDARGAKSLLEVDGLKHVRRRCRTCNLPDWAGGGRRSELEVTTECPWRNSTLQEAIGWLGTGPMEAGASSGDMGPGGLRLGRQ
ncbi:hypothetical protein DCS_00472 [Drechmeria coniospora]|uniref:Uncharacterized protein n=1 Tax=Drechmeria coniospora TaxID=98403 RepID=A0A151GQS0_DRECN|nr:hypothetical protein DCS_00472 [Drechmeria coniospora]KYK59342.1 hypothetical protein DCS_00472 [Drechmeria coniospora]